MTAEAAIRVAPTTRDVAARVAALRFADLPADVVEVVRQCALDTIGAALAGRDEPASRIVVEQCLAEGGAGRATIVGEAGLATARQAALANGTIGHALDFDDVALAIKGHVSVVVLAAVLAAAEERAADGHPVDGRAVATAFVAGYEAACAIGATMMPGHDDRGFHPTGTFGAFGAAAAVARLLDLDAAATARAFGLAGTMASGIIGAFGTMAKPLQAGRAAENGLMAAMLAARGFGAREDILERRQGFAATHADRFDQAGLLARPPGGFHIRDNLFKLHACCFGTFAAIESARAIKDRIAAADVRRIVIAVSPEQDRVCNIAEPRSANEARFSLRHAVAMVLAGHDTGDDDAFGAPSLGDPAVTTLRSRTEVRLTDRLTNGVGEVTVETAAGSRKARYDATRPERDLQVQRARVAQKFDRLARGALGDVRAAELKDAILAIDTLDDIGRLTALCRPSTGGTA